MPARFRHTAVRLIAAATLIAAQTMTAAAQDTVTQAEPVSVPPDVGRDHLAVIFTQAELAQLLAPIALYPDQLVTQILMAAGYPLEVIEAERWLRDPQHAALTGDALAAALQPIDWDPSVKSLVPFPQILALMEQRPDWVRKLGVAFIVQQAEVMDAVQRLRYAAWDTGALRSSDRLTVTPLDDTITITPAAPNIVYVPVYDPGVVYGQWPYPAYPPMALGPAFIGGLGFGVGYVIVRRYWDWQHCDWRRHRIVVDAARVNVINANFSARDRWRSAGGSWSHDPRHRRGLTVNAASVDGAAAHVPWRAAPTRVAPQSIQSNQLPPRVAISPPAHIERRDRGPDRFDAARSTAALPPPVSAPSASDRSRPPGRPRSTAAPAPGAAAPQFQGAPTTQFRNAPTTQFRNAPTTQFRNAPTTQFQNAPTTHFNNAPTQFRAAPSAPVPRAHVAPSSPAPLAHVAPSRPAAPAHVAPSQPAASAPVNSDRRGRH